MIKAAEGDQPCHTRAYRVKKLFGGARNFTTAAFESSPRRFLDASYTGDDRRTGASETTK